MQIKKLYLLAALGSVLYSCSSNKASVEHETEMAGTEAPAAGSELHRPQFHFTPPAKWMNDPNGMVYHNGEYHLFYQHNPDTTVWAPMHWGHAVSKDMVSWEHLPIALYPDSLGMIFSGSAVVDKNNTSGFGTDGNPAMVAIYTYHDMPGEKAGKDDYQSQGIAYSLDNGRTWTKYAQNPVLKSPNIRDFRDPKVSWYEAGKKWVMTLAVADHIRFYTSKNLKDWKLEGQFGQNIGGHGGVWECPDLFKMKVAGTNEEKWVLLVSINPGGPNGGSATQYFVGDFDGSTFKLDPQFEANLKGEYAVAGTPVNKGKGIWIDYGRDNYAGVTWANVPESDGRRLFLGWMSNWDYANVVPTENWRSAMTVARTLELEKTDAGLRIVSKPVKELENIFGTSYTLEAQTVTDALALSEKAPFKTATFDLQLELEPVGEAAQFAIELSNDMGQKVLIGYDATRKQYYIDRREAGKHDFSDKFGGIHYAPRIASDATFPLRLVVDVASVELFADNGKTVMTDVFFPDDKFTKVSIIADKGEVKLKSGTLTEVKSIYSAVQ
ncbi:glycoside hydrolase family 32 protein [Pontibacter sp. E15-1]|uniref:glycoside hydrolase family 32 protein n=1 Tax=Pontibacter sp. E15-1 TaxID=2919918 RepID=UPI001F4F78EB|nr:glycoside hydrolase family 32 protein [Pontibacter sp. E15-1]MCJ8167303.1 glycoside hydrolase family 32 protein [Pontibacter sp. E15-1]